MAGALRFVVNRHHATTLHFDLRLEVGSVLVSWAVPKGFSLDPADKRLAIRVEDHGLHDLTYEDAGKIVWDTGTYLPTAEPASSLAAGHLRFTLDGEKLRGDFALTHVPLAGAARGWLLVKVSDEQAVPGHEWTPDDHYSVLSGRWLDADE